MTNADKFKGIFGIYATELWSKPEKEFLEWLNAEVTDTNAGDTISRQAAIDALWKVKITPGGEIFNAIKRAQQSEIEALPSAQPDNRLSKIADLAEGTIDHFDLDDAMDLLYQIKEVLKNG